MGVTYNCVNCNKQYKRREDLVRLTKKCLTVDLTKGDDENNPPAGPSTSRDPPPPNAPSEAITILHQDLTMSDSDDEDEVVTRQSRALENQILSSKISREIVPPIKRQKLVMPKEIPKKD